MKILIEDMDPLMISGARNTVYLVPAAETKDGVPRVTLYSGVGPGLPEAAYHGRWLAVANVDRNAVGAQVRKALEGKADALGALAGLYRGATVDYGNNLVGTWGDEDGTEVEGLLDEVEQALADVGTFWEACDWFAPAWPETEADMAAWSGDLDSFVEHELERAAGDGVYLRDDDVREALIERLGDFLRDYDGEGADEAERKLYRVAALWAPLGDDDLGDLTPTEPYPAAWLQSRHWVKPERVDELPHDVTASFTLTDGRDVLMRVEDPADARPTYYLSYARCDTWNGTDDLAEPPVSIASFTINVEVVS